MGRQMETGLETWIVFLLLITNATNNFSASFVEIHLVLAVNYGRVSDFHLKI